MGMFFRIIFIILILLSIHSIGLSQTFISQKQSYFDTKSHEEIFVDGERKVIINGNTFTMTLPPNNVEFKGKFKKRPRKTLMELVMKSTR